MSPGTSACHRDVRPVIEINRSDPTTTTTTTGLSSLSMITVAQHTDTRKTEHVNYRFQPKKVPGRGVCAGHVTTLMITNRYTVAT